MLLPEEVRVKRVNVKFELKKKYTKNKILREKQNKLIYEMKKYTKN